MFSFWVLLLLPQKTRRENEGDVKLPNVTFSCSVLNQNSLFLLSGASQIPRGLLSKISVFKGIFFHAFLGKTCGFTCFSICFCSLCLCLLPTLWQHVPPAKLSSGIKSAAGFNDDPSVRLGKAGGENLLQPGISASSLPLAPHPVFPLRNGWTWDHHGLFHPS